LYATELGLKEKDAVGGGDPTKTVSVELALPPGPVQVKVTVLDPVSGPYDPLPLVDGGRIGHEKEQEVALVDDQLAVVVPLYGTEFGLKENEAVGAGDPTVTVAVELALPPPPLQVKVTVLVPVSGPYDPLPLVDGGKIGHENEQESALVEDQLAVVVPLYGTEFGLKEKETVGAGQNVSGQVETATLESAVP